MSQKLTAQNIQILIAEGEGLSVEFKQKYSSKIAQDIVAFANSKGGRILLGVADDGSIVGEKLTNAMKAEIVHLAKNCEPPINVSVSQGNQIVVIDVPESDDKPHMCSSGCYKRYDAITQKLTPQDIRKVLRTEAISYFESRENPSCKLESISLDKVKRFLKTTGVGITVTRKNVSDFLESHKLLQHNKITNAGLMMFARDVSQYIMHCQTYLVAYKGTEGVHIYDRKYVRDDLLTQFDEANAFVEKHLNIRSEIRGRNRNDIYEIPLEAIREAITNALVHRDYNMFGTNIQIEVHSDRVVVSNPGGLPEGLTLSLLGRKSIRRNEIIADLFHRMGKMERVGSGIRRIISCLKEAGLKPPKFESDSFFTVTFARSEKYRSLQESVPLRIPQSYPRATPELPQNYPKTTPVRSGTADRIRGMMIKNPMVTRKELARRLKLTIDGIKYHIRKMISQKLIKRVGPHKGGRWVVLK